MESHVNCIFSVAMSRSVSTKPYHALATHKKRRLNPMSDDTLGFAEPEEIDSLAFFEDSKALLEGIFLDKFEKGTALAFGDIVLTRAHVEMNAWRVFHDGDQVDTFNASRAAGTHQLQKLLRVYHEAVATGDEPDYPDPIEGMFA